MEICDVTFVSKKKKKNNPKNKSRGQSCKRQSPGVSEGAKEVIRLQPEGQDMISDS